MRNNILGGLVIFFVVVTCLLMLDDISNLNEETFAPETIQVEETETTEQQSDLAVIEGEE